MTRDFNEHRRDDRYSSSRNQSSGRYGEERTPRPARPRLNRQTVDRAWESGARRDHADYRTRSNNEQPPRSSHRRNQYSDYASTQNSRKPLDDRQDSYQRSQRTFNSEGSQSSRPRSYDPNARHHDDRRTNERLGYSRRPNDAGPRTGSGFRDSDQRSPSRSSDTRSPLHLIVVTGRPATISSATGQTPAGRAVNGRKTMIAHTRDRTSRAISISRAITSALRREKYPSDRETGHHSSASARRSRTGM